MNMYERMLDKQNQPAYEEFAEYCGACKDLFEQTDAFLIHELKAEKLMRFPYGNDYGWGIKYSLKKKLICDIFAEKDAFTIMLRLTDTQFEQVYAFSSTYTQEYIDNKYPCGNGGWIHYRVLTSDHLEDAKRMLEAKVV